MPAPKMSEKHEDFIKMHQASQANGDTNDCAVKAVAAACNADYDRVSRLMRDLGRKKGKGTQGSIILKAIRQLGFDIVDSEGKPTHFYAMEPFAPEYFTKHYPGNHKALKNVTTHHPDRFPKAPVWKGRTYLFLTAGGGHIVCIKDGQNIDWSRGRAQRACTIVEVVPA